MNPWFEESGGDATDREDHGEGTVDRQTNLVPASSAGTLIESRIDVVRPPTREGGNRGPVVLIQYP